MKRDFFTAINMIIFIIFNIVFIIKAIIYVIPSAILTYKKYIMYFAKKFSKFWVFRKIVKTYEN